MDADTVYRPKEDLLVTVIVYGLLYLKPQAQSGSCREKYSCKSDDAAGAGDEEREHPYDLRGMEAT
jgi:hypothetical protein